MGRPRHVACWPRTAGRLRLACGSQYSGGGRCLHLVARSNGVGNSRLGCRRGGTPYCARLSGRSGFRVYIDSSLKAYMRHGSTMRLRGISHELERSSLAHTWRRECGRGPFSTPDLLTKRSMYKNIPASPSDNRDGQSMSGAVDGLFWVQSRAHRALCLRKITKSATPMNGNTHEPA